MTKPYLLLLEDDPNDTALLRSAFQKLGFGQWFRSVLDGREGADYLEGKGPYGNREHHPIPDLIILDLKMPRMNGFEFLSWLRAHPTLSETAVVILTSSEDPRDIERARQYRIVSYLVKPGGLQRILDCSAQIVRMAQAIKDGKAFASMFPSA